MRRGAGSGIGREGHPRLAADDRVRCMPDEVRAEPVELARLAGRTLDAAVDLEDGWRRAQRDLAIPATAYGTLSAGQGIHRAHAAATEDGDAAVSCLVAVYEGDVDRLYRVSFAYQQADREAAERADRARQVGPGSLRAK
jgi:hypothetical protein